MRGFFINNLILNRLNLSSINLLNSINLNH